MKFYPDIPKSPPCSLFTGPALYGPPRVSPEWYLADQRFTVKYFACMHEIVTGEIFGRPGTVRIDMCTYQGRCPKCLSQAVGHDPGDEDPVAP